MSETINERVERLRQWMRDNGIAAFLFPSTDPHMGEYVPDHWKAREWITGFTGSAGTAIVGLKSAALWTDSRYWLAAEEQMDGTPFDVVRCRSNAVPTADVAEWVEKNVGRHGQVVGVDAWVYAQADVQRLDSELISRGYILSTNLDPTQEVWTDRPPLPGAPVAIQPLELAGRTVARKLADIREAIARNHADALLVSALDEVAWTLNLRGNDVHCTPLFVAYLLVRDDSALLYINEEKLTPPVRKHLAENGVELRPYGSIQAERSMTLQYDPDSTNAGIMNSLTRSLINSDSINVRLICHPSPITEMKAVKNDAEVSGFRRAMLRDGVAMVKFLRRMSSDAQNVKCKMSNVQWQKEDGKLLMDGKLVTEITVDKLLTALRAEQEGFRGLSFDTIAAYGPHAAIVHYEATPESDIPLEAHGLLLLDSGGQYIDGTTDITRTIALGPLTDDERRDYTLVLKGHIRLANAVFPEGTTGTQLDVLARYAMWQEHKNYGHGTGHGVGSFLSVHEGPHQFRMNWMPAPLRANMTVTIEPGIYIAGSHGARIENTMLIVADNDPAWLRLEPLTICPIDTTPIIRDMLLPDEILYLNNYHARVREALLPLLDTPEDRQWLIDSTQPI